MTRLSLIASCLDAGRVPQVLKEPRNLGLDQIVDRLFQPVLGISLTRSGKTIVLESTEFAGNSVGRCL